MKREALYHADTNELEELPQMEKREHPKGSDFHEWAEYVKYTNHVTALRRLPCSPQPGFKDGEKYVEGVGYEVRACCDHNCKGTCEKIHSTVYAFPLIPVKSDDELWKELIVSIVADVEYGAGIPSDKIIELKQKYIITKR